jgi:hypothetical protein
MIEPIEEMGVEIPLKDRSLVLENVRRDMERSKGIYGDCYQPQRWPVLEAHGGGSIASRR